MDHDQCPPPQGLYDPSFEHDACGVGFVVNVKGVRSHGIVRQALKVIPAERLVLSSDCGMGREGMSRRHAFYKMVALVQGVNVVKKELGLPVTESLAGKLLTLPPFTKVRPSFIRDCARALRKVADQAALQGKRSDAAA